MEPFDNTTAETDYTDNRHVPAMTPGSEDSADDGVIMHDLGAPEAHENGSTPDELGETLAAQIIPPSGWSPSAP